MTNLIRVQINNKCNSTLIAKLKIKSTLIKRTGIRPVGRANDHLGCPCVHNYNQGLATFDIDPGLLGLVPNDCHVLTNGQRMSVTQYRSSTQTKLQSPIGCGHKLLSTETEGK